MKTALPGGQGGQGHSNREEPAWLKDRDLREHGSVREEEIAKTGSYLWGDQWDTQG